MAKVGGAMSTAVAFRKRHIRVAQVVLSCCARFRGLAWLGARLASSTAVGAFAWEPLGAVEVAVEVVEEAVVVARLTLQIQRDRLQVTRLARYPRKRF